MPSTTIWKMSCGSTGSSSTFSYPELNEMRPSKRFTSVADPVEAFQKRNTT